MSNYSILSEAITNKQSISCTYKSKTRHMSPHTLGTKNGLEKVLLVQYGGESSKGLGPNPEDNWRCLFVSELSNISINNDAFITASNHSIGQSCIDKVAVEIDY